MNKPEKDCLECGESYAAIDLDVHGICPFCNANDESKCDKELYGFEEEDFNDDFYDPLDDWEGDDWEDDDREDDEDDEW